jgi:dTDP-glucose 4,6-dehydratase
MNILVTGGNGFIGSNFINHIINLPEVNSIVNVDCLTYAANLANLPDNNKIKNYSLNITDDIAMYNIMYNNNITHIVHFAAESHVDNSISGPKKFIETNINGTFSLLEASRKLKGLVRFHHVSTDEVYGSLHKEDAAFSETTPYDPRSPYSSSKASSDHLVRAYYHTYNLPVSISNCSNNYGPRQHKEKLIPKIISNIKEGKKVPIYGKGDNIRDWLYVEDHCEAIWKILNNVDSKGETYNIGGDCEMTNNQILEHICKVMNVNVNDYREYVEDRKGHDFRYAINFRKIQSKLGWNPKTNFEEGIKNTIKFYYE